MYGDLTPKGSPAENSSPNAFNLIETIICFSDWKIRIQLELVRRAIFTGKISQSTKQIVKTALLTAQNRKVIFQNIKAVFGNRKAVLSGRYGYLVKKRAKAGKLPGYLIKSARRLEFSLPYSHRDIPRPPCETSMTQVLTFLTTNDRTILACSLQKTQ